MKKFFIVTDVHSFFTPMQEALNREGFNLSNPDHIFVSLGDLFDRGDETIKLLEWVNNIPDERKILIRGNHEDLLEEVFKNKYFRPIDYSNGTAKTVNHLAGRVTFSDSNLIEKASENEGIRKYLNSLLDYYEIGNYILTHSWIPSFDSTNWKLGDWKKARWVNPFLEWRNRNYPQDKSIICGHWHVSWGWSHIRREYKEWPPVGRPGFKESFKPFIDKGIIALDACTAFSGICNCFVINEEDI